MLPSLVLHHIERADETKLGVSVDVRSGINIQEAQEQIQYLRDEGHQVEVLFVEAEEACWCAVFRSAARPSAVWTEPYPAGKLCKRA